MDEARDLSSQEKENLAGAVDESLGEPEKSVDGENEPTEQEDLPLAAKEKIGKIKKRYDRDIRRMERRLADMENRLGNQQPSQDQSQQYGDEMSREPSNPHVDEQIQRAVSVALRAKEADERKAHEQKQHDYVRQQYQKLQDNLDKASEKYDDFDEVVRGHDAPFTPAIRDAALMLDNPGDVLYKLGKDKDKLAQISKLHPLDQAREIWKLSVALMGGGESSKSSQSQSRPLGQVKSNPVLPSQNVTEKTSVGDLRRLMKAGWKS